MRNGSSSGNTTVRGFGSQGRGRMDFQFSEQAASVSMLILLDVSLKAMTKGWRIS